MNDPFFQKPTLSELLDNLRERSAEYREAQTLARKAERESVQTAWREKETKAMLDCAERAVVEYMRTNGSDIAKALA